ncbi:MAG TPA: hypothetical protein VGF79_02980 [Bacteroidia bacterium]
MGLFNKIKTKTNEFARVIEWTPRWDTGAPMPQVFSNGHKVFLIYIILEQDSNWDGTDVTMVDNTSVTTYPLALVEFNGHSFRFGIANDEVYNGLPLWNKGLEGYSAHIIENSSWINELKNINKVHQYYNEDSWKDEKHFALLFKDDIFEIIATDYKIETFNSSLELLAMEVAKRMNS